MRRCIRLFLAICVWNGSARKTLREFPPFCRSAAEPTYGFFAVRSSRCDRLATIIKWTGPVIWEGLTSLDDLLKAITQTI